MTLMNSRNLLINVLIVVVPYFLLTLFIQSLVSSFNDISFQNNQIPYFYLFEDQSNIFVIFYNYARLLTVEITSIFASILTLDISSLQSTVLVFIFSVILIFAPLYSLNKAKKRSTN